MVSQLQHWQEVGIDAKEPQVRQQLEKMVGIILPIGVGAQSWITLEMPAPTQKTLESALRITENETQYQSVAHQDGEAKKEALRAFGLIDLKLPNPGRSKKRKPKTKRT